MTSELPKCCAFCGDDVVLDHSDSQMITFILCDSCGAVVSFRPRLIGQDAIHAFNRRASDA